MKQAFAGLAATGTIAGVAYYHGFGQHPPQGPPPHKYEISETDEIRTMFADHMTTYGKTYGTKEELEFRLRIFRENAMAVAWHNQHDGAYFQMGLNQFATWTREEYQQLLGYRTKKQAHKRPHMLGQNGHGLPPAWLGQDGHGQPPHMMGQDGHGQAPHMLGENGHGLPPAWLGQDGHGQPPQMMGQDGHGQQQMFEEVHGQQQMFGQDGHGLPPQMMGQDGHGQAPHMLGQNGHGLPPPQFSQQRRNLEVSDLPASIDWRTQGSVTKVKNQGQCGSCWAFSSTGAMEGAWVAAGKNLTSFSEQELVDCSHNGPDKDDKNDGCNGGDMDLAFAWAMNNTMVTEDSYPYTAEDGKCNNGSSSLVDIGKVKNYTDIEPKSPVALATALTDGPVSIAVNAASLGWQLYFGGILKHFCEAKSEADLDHGVLLVGYGTDSDSNEDYWIVKNSWGAEWGEQGYIRLARDMDTKGPGECGLQLAAVIPTM